MERELRILEMDEMANPVALARSRLVHDRFPREYATTRARCAISLKAVMHSDDDLWSLVMLPDAPPVSGLFPFSFILLPRVAATLTFHSSQERVTVNATRFDPPTPRARARTRAAQRREQERAARKEWRIRWRERQEQRDEEFWLRDQQGLFPPATSDYSSSGEEEEEESDGGRAPLRGGSMHPLVESRGGSRGASDWGGRGSTHHRAVHGRGGAHRGGAWQCDGGDAGHSHSARRALEEEEAGLLHLEVGHRSYRRPVLERQEFNLSAFASAGWRRPSPPRARQGAEGGCVHPHEAALLEGAVGDKDYGGGNERGPAQRGRIYGAAAGGDGHYGGHDHGGHHSTDFDGACPCRRQSGGGGGGPG
jgi:hypothetical protein